MIFFITVLRALAACLITNAHYTGIYPTDLIANGGLLGDVLFFAVSGYCLSDLKMPFVKWYIKRIYRIYPAVWIMTTIYISLGFYQMSERGIWGWFLYPTGYHFIASIIMLYIPFYFFMKIDVLKNNIFKVMVGIAAIWFIGYWLLYDKSYYHIDAVREPFIRFLFLECMLLGVLFKQNDKKLRNNFKWRYLLLTMITFVVYFASKLVFSKVDALSQLQFINQIIIFILLYYIFRTFCSLDEWLEKLPVFIKKIIQFVSSITLEIYLVQYVLIELIRPVTFFPLNWIMLTSIILFSAWVLHKVCNSIYKLGDVCISNFNKR